MKDEHNSLGMAGIPPRAFAHAADPLRPPVDPEAVQASLEAERKAARRPMVERRHTVDMSVPVRNVVDMGRPHPVEEAFAALVRKVAAEELTAEDAAGRLLRGLIILGGYDPDEYGFAAAARAAAVEEMQRQADWLRQEEERRRAWELHHERMQRLRTLITPTPYQP